MLFSGFLVVAVVVGFATNLLPYVSVTYSTAVVVVAEVLVVLKKIKGFCYVFIRDLKRPSLPTASHSPKKTHLSTYSEDLIYNGDLNTDHS